MVPFPPPCASAAKSAGRSCLGLVTVPRYAPGIYGIVTWYDQAVSMARTGSDGRFNSPRTTSFTHDIYPILKRADDLSGVHGVAHANGAVRPLSDAARIAEFADPAKRAARAGELTPVGTAAADASRLPPDDAASLQRSESRSRRADLDLPRADEVPDGAHRQLGARQLRCRLARLRASSHAI